jgi:hypothetical protein
VQTVTLIVLTVRTNWDKEVIEILFHLIFWTSSLDNIKKKHML